MPCWTVQETTIEFLEKSTNVDLLKAALEKMGFRVNDTSTHLHFYGNGLTGTYTKATGKIETRGSSKLDVNEVKREYSEQCVNNQAAEYGWEVDWSTNENGEREATVIRRW